MWHRFAFLAVMLPAVLWAAKEGGLVFLVLPMNFVKRLFYFISVFFFPSDPGTRISSLRNIVGLGNNLKPYNLLCLRVSLSSETNPLSLDLVYEPLLLFSSRISFVVQANIRLVSIFF